MPLRGNDAIGRFCPNEDDWGHCATSRRLTFDLDEADLTAIAKGHATSPSDAARFRIEEREGRHWDGVIAPAEAAGLLLAVERARRPG